ncbi:MAG: hypothetical protein OEY49_09950, partial [Candidatus Heimdallarchaeota archaeon]|nr:hypothetical protein [Candidatus Heimdallarchaeota archaeon]
MYESTKAIWKRAQHNWKQSKQDGNPEFSHIFKAERNMRKNFLRFIFETIPGNTETKRVYNWHNGNIGGLNLLFNFAGSILRDYAMKLYPFSLDDITKRGYYHYYAHPNFGKVYLAHPTLPELDFIDMIRAHMYELCRQLFRYNVPAYASYGYLNRLVLDLLPFLDWVYIGGRKGVNSRMQSPKKEKPHSFMRDMDTILKLIIEDVRLHYEHYQDTTRITQIIEENKDKKEINYLIFKKFVKQHGIESYLVDTGYFNLEAFNKFWEKKTQILQTLGSRCHEFMSYGLPQHKSISHFIRYGDEYDWQNQGYFIAAEVKLQEGTQHGRADYVVFKRIRISNRNIWRPMMVLDLKTTSGLDFDFYGKGEDKVRLNFAFKTRPLYDDEFHSFQSNILSTAGKQLSRYSKIILEQYKKEIRIHNKLVAIPQGIICLDTAEKWGETREELHLLILALIKRLEGDKDEITQLLQNNYAHSNDRYAFSNSYSDKKLSIIMKPYHSDTQKYLDTPYVKTNDLSIPFTKSKYSDTTIIQYLSVASADASGNSAAWIATYQHLIPYVVEQHSDASIVLLDIMGFFNIFIHQRLRSKDIQHDVDRIEIVSVNNFLQHRKLPVLDADVIILSGWNEFNNIRLLGEEQYTKPDIMEWIRELNADTVYIINDAEKTAHTSDIYQMNKVKHGNYPCHQLIWNLPAPPRNKRTKISDDHRIIIYHDDSNIRADIVNIPVLKDYTQRFIQSRRSPILTKKNKFALEDLTVEELKANTLITKAMTLIPDVARYFNIAETQQLNDIDIDLYKISLVNKRQFISYTDLFINYTKYKHKSEINTRYRSRKEYQLCNDHSKTTSKPPPIKYLEPRINLHQAVEWEILKITNSIDFINKIIPEPSIKELLQQLSKIITDGGRNRDIINDINREIQIWDQKHSNIIDIIDDCRKIIFNRYIRPHQKKLELINPELERLNGRDLNYFGNDIVLLLLQLVSRHEKMDTDRIYHQFMYLSPWLLLRLGYLEQYPDNYPQSIYHLKKIWRKIHLNLTELSDEIDTLLDKTYGWLIQRGKHTLMIIEDETPAIGIFSNSINQILMQSSCNLYSISNPKYMIDVYQHMDQEILQSSDLQLPILQARYRGKQKLWVWVNNKWEFVGNVFMKKTETNRIMIFGLSFSYAPDLDEDKFEPRIDWEKIHSSVNEITRIIPEYVQLRVGVTSDENYFIVEYYALDDEEDNCLDKDLFENTVDLIQHLRIPDSGRYHVIEDTYYTWNKFNISYNKVGFIKQQVISKKEIIIGDDYPYYPGDIFTYEHNITMTINVSHLDEQCRIKNLTLEDILEDQPKMLIKMSSENRKFYGRKQLYFHYDCWKLSFNDDYYNDLLNDRYSGREIARLWEAGEIFDDYNNTRIILEFEFNEDTIYQEDRLILYVYRSVSAKWWLIQVDPNSRKLENMYTGTRIQELDNTLSIIFQHLTDGTFDYY